MILHYFKRLEITIYNFKTLQSENKMKIAVLREIERNRPHQAKLHPKSQTMRYNV